MNSSSSFIYSTDEPRSIKLLDSARDSENPILPMAPEPRTLPKSVSGVEYSNRPPSGKGYYQSEQHRAPVAASDPHLNFYSYSMHERQIRYEEHFDRNKELVKRIQTTNERLYSGHYWTRIASMSQIPDAIQTETTLPRSLSRKEYPTKRPTVSETREQFTDPSKRCSVGKCAAYSIPEYLPGKPTEQSRISRIDQISGDRDALPQMASPCGLRSCPAVAGEALGKEKSEFCFTKRSDFEPPACMMRGRPCRPSRSRSLPNRSSTSDIPTHDPFATTYIYNPRSDSSDSFNKKTIGPFPGDYEEFHPFQSNISFHGPLMERPYTVSPRCSGGACGFRPAAGKPSIPPSPAEPVLRRSHLDEIHVGRSNPPDRFLPLSSQYKLPNDMDPRFMPHPSPRETRESSPYLPRHSIPVTPKRSPRKSLETLGVLPRHTIQSENDEHQKRESLTPKKQEKLTETRKSVQSNLKSVSRKPEQLFDVITSSGQEVEACSQDRIQPEEPLLPEELVYSTGETEHLVTSSLEGVQYGFKEPGQPNSSSSPKSKYSTKHHQTNPEQQNLGETVPGREAHLDSLLKERVKSSGGWPDNMLTGKGSPMERIPSCATIPSTVEPRQSKADSYLEITSDIEENDKRQREIRRILDERLSDSEVGTPAISLSENAKFNMQELLHPAWLEDEARVPLDYLDPLLADNDGELEVRTQRSPTSRPSNEASLVRKDNTECSQERLSPIQVRTESSGQIDDTDVVPREPPKCPFLEVEEITLTAEPSATERTQDVVLKPCDLTEKSLDLVKTNSPQSTRSSKAENVTVTTETSMNLPLRESSTNRQSGILSKGNYPGVPSANAYRTMGSVGNSPAGSQSSFLEGRLSSRNTKEPVNAWDVDSTLRAIQPSVYGAQVQAERDANPDHALDGIAAENSGRCSVPSKPTMYQQIQKQLPQTETQEIASTDSRHPSVENNMGIRPKERVDLGISDMEQQAVQDVPAVSLTEHVSDKPPNTPQKKSVKENNQEYGSSPVADGSFGWSSKPPGSLDGVCTAEPKGVPERICHGSMETRQPSVVSSRHTSQSHSSVSTPKREDLKKESITSEAPKKINQPLTLSELYDNSTARELSSVESEKRKNVSVGYVLHDYRQQKFLGIIPPLPTLPSPSSDIGIDQTNLTSEEHGKLPDKHSKPSTVHETMILDESGLLDNPASNVIPSDNDPSKSPSFTGEKSHPLIDTATDENPFGQQDRKTSTHNEKITVGDRSSSRRSRSRSRQESSRASEPQLSPFAGSPPSADSNASHTPELNAPEVEFLRHCCLDQPQSKPCCDAADLLPNSLSWKDISVSKQSSHAQSKDAFESLFSGQLSISHELNEGTELISPKLTQEVVNQFALETHDKPEKTNSLPECVPASTSSSHQSRGSVISGSNVPVSAVLGNIAILSPPIRAPSTQFIGSFNSDGLLANAPYADQEQSEVLSAILAATVTATDLGNTRPSLRTTSLPVFDLQGPFEMQSDQASVQSNIFLKDGIRVNESAKKSQSEEDIKSDFPTQNMTNTTSYSCPRPGNTSAETEPLEIGNRNSLVIFNEQPQPDGESQVRFSPTISDVGTQKKLPSNTKFQHPFCSNTKPNNQSLNQCDVNLEIHHDLVIYATTSGCCSDQLDRINSKVTDRPTSSHSMQPKCVVDVDPSANHGKLITNSGMEFILRGCQQPQQQKPVTQRKREQCTSCPVNATNDGRPTVNIQNRATSPILDLTTTNEGIGTNRKTSTINPHSFNFELNCKPHLDANSRIASLCKIQDSIRIAYSDVISSRESDAPFATPNTQVELILIERAPGVEYVTNRFYPSDQAKHEPDGADYNNNGYSMHSCDASNSSVHEYVISPHRWKRTCETYPTVNRLENEPVDSMQSIRLRYSGEMSTGHETATDSSVTNHECCYPFAPVSNLLDRAQSTPPRRSCSDCLCLLRERPLTRIENVQGKRCSFRYPRELVRNRSSGFRFGNPASLLNKLLSEKENILRQCLSETHAATNYPIGSYKSIKNSLGKMCHLNDDQNRTPKNRTRMHATVRENHSSTMYAEHRTSGLYQSVGLNGTGNKHRDKRHTQNSNYPQPGAQAIHSVGLGGPVNLYFDKNAVFVRGETRDDEIKHSIGTTQEPKYSADLKNSHDVAHSGSVCPVYTSTPRHVHYSPALHGTVKDMVYNSNKITPEAQEILLIIRDTIKMIMQDLAALDGQMLDRNFRACEAISEHLVLLPNMLNALLDHLRYSPVEYDLVHLVTALNGLITEIASDPVIVLFHLIELGYRLNELARILGEDLVPNDMPQLVHAVQSKLHRLKIGHVARQYIHVPQSCDYLVTPYTKSRQLLRLEEDCGCIVNLIHPEDPRAIYCPPGYRTIEVVYDEDRGKHDLFLHRLNYMINPRKQSIRLVTTVVRQMNGKEFTMKAEDANELLRCQVRPRYRDIRAIILSAGKYNGVPR
ncbi:hypothetical protein D915_003486 [Fasciola hepatica]|uniref:Uncharacterized protein n=1 Tax=Fasciola hepatica TaxID=6192 RepID=A0A4E0RUL9_FASHE|nr:hypothetical protein D915_003486 [Fasciola hepatica]